MEGRIEIKDRKLQIEIPLDQEYVEVVVFGSLDKAKQLVAQFVMKEEFEKIQKKNSSGIIKPGVVH